MSKSIECRPQRSPSHWRRACLTGLVLSVATSGCSMPGKLGNLFSGKSDTDNQIRIASYQEGPVDEEPSKKISDPIGLKLGYAKWMEEIKNYPEAQNHYNLVLQERPEEVDALLGLARIDQAGNRMEAAEAGFKKAISLQPDSPAAKHSLGQFYASQERWHEALPLLNDAMLADPNNKSYRFHLAVALASSGDVNAAYPHFNQTVGEAVARYNIGMILKSKGQYRQAEQQFLQALAKNPRLEEAKQAITQVRQLSQATGTYAAQPALAPQIHPAGHQQQTTLTPRQQEQLRNQRTLQR